MGRQFAFVKVAPMNKFAIDIESFFIGHWSYVVAGVKEDIESSSIFCIRTDKESTEQR